MTKYIFVTGGVVSGLGKGITAASLGRLLKQRGLKIAAQKLDPYMNVDPGTMNPLQHGEVFVTDDGAETDLDLGHYERFIDENLTKFSNLTSGRVYHTVINRERAGGYLGETVQVIPHITDEIKKFIYSETDILITEIGGTTGDIESQPFIEAIRQISLEIGRENCLFIHVVLVPYLKFTGEFKSKPAQHSVKGLQEMGISPDIIITRSDEKLNKDILNKLSLFCNVKSDCVIENLTLECLYEVPLMLHETGLDEIVCRELSIETREPDLSEWQILIENIKAIEKNDSINIAIVGKYIRLHDAYLSVVEALNHAGFSHGVKVLIKWIDSETVDDENAGEILKDIDGIIIPGGFGSRGIEGKISACRYARENDMPYLGLCLGMQIAVIEFARNVCGLSTANSREFDESSDYKVIDIMDEQTDVVNTGGTMRLGSYPCKIVPNTKFEKLYNSAEVTERHRHRYEFNNCFRDIMTKKGLVVCGMSPDESLVEAIELPDKRFFIGVQFHPEFKSRPNKPHPLFKGFLESALEIKNKQKPGGLLCR